MLLAVEHFFLTALQKSATVKIFTFENISAFTAKIHLKRSNPF